MEGRGFEPEPPVQFLPKNPFVYSFKKLIFGGGWPPVHHLGATTTTSATPSNLRSARQLLALTSSASHHPLASPTRPHLLLHPRPTLPQPSASCSSPPHSHTVRALPNSTPAPHHHFSPTARLLPTSALLIPPPSPYPSSLSPAPSPSLLPNSPSTRLPRLSQPSATLLSPRPPLNPPPPFFPSLPWPLWSPPVTWATRG
jgi:hypothetical protein